MLNLPSTTKISEPGDWIGKAIFGLILFGIGALLFKYSAEILESMHNLTMAVIYGLILCAILYVVFDDNIRRMVWNGYQNQVRKLQRMVIAYDPIGTLRNYIDLAREKRNKMNEHLTSFSGQKKRMERQIQENESTIQDNLRRAQAAKQAMQQEDDEMQRLRFEGELITCTEAAGLLQQSNKNMQPTFEVLNRMYSMLQKMYIQSEFLIKQMEMKVSIKEVEYEAIKSGSRVIREAGILFGDTDDKKYFDMSVDLIKEDIGMRLGAMDRFMENASSVVTSIDVQKGMAKNNGLQMLEEFEKNEFGKIFNTKIGEPLKVAQGKSYPVQPTINIQATSSRKSSLLD